MKLVQVGFLFGVIEHNLLMMLFYCQIIYSKNYAILLNSSKGFHNYRHMANVFVFYEILKKNGLEDDQIIILSCENPLKDTTRCTDEQLIYLDNNKRIHTPDFDVTDRILETFLNCIEGCHQKLKDADETANVLVYACGHGNESFLKLGDISFVTKNDFMVRIKKFASRVNKILFLLDTCQAEALIDRSILPSNVFALTTSKHGESSFSFFCSSSIHAHVVDNFPYLFFEMVSDENFERNMKLMDLFSDLNLENRLGSTLTFNTNEDFTFREFFVKNSNTKLLQFVL